MLTPAIWILCGVGFDQDLTGRARDNGGIESLSGVLLLLLAGTAYAILLFSPISPAGPTLAGLAFAGAGAWARIAPEAYAAVWPANVAKDGFNVSTPGYGLVVLMAVPLLGTALSASRWRAFEPPEILLIGTIGRARGAARVAGTPMASEQTTVIPQQRQSPEFVPGFGARPADPRRLPADDDRTIAVPLGRPAFGEEDEKTTVMQLGRPPAARPAPEELTQLLTPAGRAAEADDRRTEPIAVAVAEETTHEVTAPGSDEVTREVAAAGAVGITPGAGEETTRDVVAAEPRTEAFGQVHAEEDDGGKTQLLTLPRATGTPDHGEQTQAIRVGTVEPPGDRTQMLTFPSPGEATTVAVPRGDEEGTTAVSIVSAERPDPGADPTTRLTPPADTAARPGPGRGTTTVTSIERPADEAADDTRPLTLPTRRPPA